MNTQKEALRALVRLAMPAIMQQVMGSVLQYVDTAMVGHLGEAATAAVSTSTSVNWLVHSVPYGFTIGFISLISQALGRGDKEEMKRLSALSLRLTLWIGAALTAVCLAVSHVLPVWMQADESVQEAASSYFFIVSVPLVFFVAGSVFSSAMHAVKDTRTPMLIQLSANVLNVLLNYIFIYVLSLGVQGAAYATAISTTAGGVGMCIAWRRKTELRFGRRELAEKNRGLLKKLSGIAFPVLLTTVVSCMGYIVFAGMVNSMGVTIFAAHSIAVTAEEIFYLPGYGIRTATSALIGIAIGEEDEKKFRATRKASLGLTAVLMLVSGTILFFVAEPLMSVFTTSRPVITLGAEVLRIVAFSEPFFGLMVAWEGISYGTGRTRGVFLIDSLSMWGVRILLTSIVVRQGYGLNAVWYCMVADNVVKAVALTVYGSRQKYRFARKEAEAIREAAG